MQGHILRNMVGVSIVSLLFSAMILTDTGKNLPNESEAKQPNAVLSDENSKSMPSEVNREKKSQSPVDTPQVRVKNRLDLLDIESETDSPGREDEMGLSARGGIGAEEVQQIELESVDPLTPEFNGLKLSDDPVNTPLSINFTTNPSALDVSSERRVDSNKDATPVEYEKEEKKEKKEKETEGSDPTERGGKPGGQHKGGYDLAHVNDIPIIKMGAYQQEANGITVIKSWDN